MTAEYIQEALCFHYSKIGWMYLANLRTGVGYAECCSQYIDGWAFSEFRKNKISNLMRAFEIKVSLSDAKVELQNPDKRWLAYSVSHEFYFVTPVGLIDKKLLSKNDGLIEVDNYGSLQIVKRANQREVMPPRWSFVGSIIRNLVSGKYRVPTEWVVPSVAEIKEDK